jgi:hypothetical protein
VVNELGRRSDLVARRLVALGDNFPRSIADFIEKSWGRCGKCFAVTCDTCAVATRYGLALVNTYKPPAFHARQKRQERREAGRGTALGDGGLTAPRSAVSRKHTSTVAQHRLSCLSCSRSRTAHARLERRREYKNQFILHSRDRKLQTLENFLGGLGGLSPRGGALRRRQACFTLTLR